MYENKLLKEIAEANLSPKNKKKLVSYINQLTKNGVPVIWGAGHLASILGIKNDIFTSMINSQISFYRSFHIPKRRGGYRELSAPYSVLLETQRWILENILQVIGVSHYAHGFVNGRSIVSNAEIHLGKKYLLKMDLEDFFPSISLKRVIAIFQNLGYPHFISYMLASLCCLNGRLPQGAATSPALSNIISKRLDSRLSAVANKWQLDYSRYADDLAFSGNYISARFIKVVSEIVQDESFCVNESKTKLVRGSGRKIITGISVSGDKLCLPKETKRKLRQEVFYLTTRGFMEHTENINDSDPLYVERLLGKLSFWKQVEPDNNYIAQSIIKVRDVQKKIDVL